MKFLILFALFASLSYTHAETDPVLPPPYKTPSASNPAKVIGWRNGKTPIAPPGFAVSLLTKMKDPRRMHLLPNGDILVTQAKKKYSGDATTPNRITLLKMNGSELVRKKTLIKGLNLPFGMALLNDKLYIAEPDRIIRFPYNDGKVTGPSEVIARLAYHQPKHHWTRDLVFNKSGSKLYVSVGSPSNVGEGGDPLDPKSAAILEMNPDGSELRIFAGGIRNPVSIAWEPTTNQLWTVVNERDGLGDDLVPDYITHVERDGFYGWPYAYWGPNEDPRRAGERPDLVAKTIKPDFSMGSHVAALGIAFTQGTKIPAPFNQGALVTEHGSWNSSKLVGYKIAYVPFEDGKAVNGEKDFLTGFIANEEKGTVYGRPVTSLILADGTVLVTDDATGRIWKVKPIR